MLNKVKTKKQHCAWRCPNFWLVVSIKWHSPQSEQSWRRPDYLLTISPGRPGTARAKGSSGRTRSHWRKCKSCLRKRLWLIDTTRGGGHSLSACVRRAPWEILEILDHWESLGRVDQRWVKWFSLSFQSCITSNCSVMIVLPVLLQGDPGRSGFNYPGPRGPTVRFSLHSTQNSGIFFPTWGLTGQCSLQGDKGQPGRKGPRGRRGECGAKAEPGDDGTIGDAVRPLIEWRAGLGRLVRFCWNSAKRLLCYSTSAQVWGGRGHLCVWYCFKTTTA